VSGRVEGRVALVTGAGKGIGQATCVRLAEEGAEPVVTSRSAEHVEGTCDLVERITGRRPLGLRLDVADGAAVDRVVDEAAERLGRIDIVVANAGFGLPDAPAVHETSDEDWARLFAVNVTGVFKVCRAALRHMPDGGAIVTVGSINSFVSSPGDGPYTATKGAVLQLTRGLAVDLAPRRIRANCVCPGIIDTPFTQLWLDRSEDPDALAAEYAAVAPLNRMGTAREIANCILFLASDEASFVTGAALVADGGTVIRP
jgi:meso-butanediol dehydrogenase / (S,S)-butanediol dehydrogenase / diacetyl reductase